MGILLTDEEMRKAYGIKGEYGTVERVAKAQLKKVVEELGNVDLPTVSDFYQDPKDIDSYVYGYHDGQERTMDAIGQALLKEVE